MCSDCVVIKNQTSLEIKEQDKVHSYTFNQILEFLPHCRDKINLKQSFVQRKWTNIITLHLLLKQS